LLVENIPPKRQAQAKHYVVKITLSG